MLQPLGVRYGLIIRTGGMKGAHAVKHMEVNFLHVMLTKRLRREPMWSSGKVISVARNHLIRSEERVLLPIYKGFSTLPPAGHRDI